jgi:CSLREA domain-containing protein
MRGPTLPAVLQSEERQEDVCPTPPSKQRPRRQRIAFVGLSFAVAGVLGLQGGFAQTEAELVVDSTRDAVDARLGDGLCATNVGECTLRAAVQEANALAAPQTIVVPAGTYSLAIPPLNDNLDDTGDYDVTDPLTIVGEGAGSTILDGGEPIPGAPPEIRSLDRLFELHPAAGDVSISGVTISGGYTADSGGGVQALSDGALRLEQVSVVDSFAKKYGGGVNYAGNGRLELVGSTLSGNGATEGGSAINNALAGTVALVAGTTVSGNPGSYPLSGGALHNQAVTDAIGTIVISDSSVSGNGAVRDGAGVSNARDGRIVVERSTISGNETTSDGGAIFTSSGTVTVSDSTISDNRALNGGGIYNEGKPTKAGELSRVELTRTVVSGNVATDAGGGILNDLAGELVLVDVTVSDNEAASEGGGVSSQLKTSLVVSRGRVSGNSAGTAGGGSTRRASSPSRSTACSSPGTPQETTAAPWPPTGSAPSRSRGRRSRRTPPSATAARSRSAPRAP